MCDTLTAPINITARMGPSGGMPLRKVSSAMLNGGGAHPRMPGGSRPASACGSQRSIRSGGSMAVPACMKPLGRSTSQCCDHPRPDCCRVPAGKPPLPKCPLGIYVERTQPIRPDRHYEAPSVPFEGLSSYREHYHQKCSARAKSFKPVSTFDPSDAKMEGLSSYRAAYTPKPSCPYQKPPWSKKAQFEPSGAKMEGASTYRVDYRGCMGERVQSLKPVAAAFDPSAAKMDGVTTYRTNYIPYCPREYKYAKQPQTMKQLVPAFSCAPMEGKSTYRSDFWPKCSARRPSMKPNSKARFSDAIFADRTTYRNDYNPFHFEKCVGPCIPANYCDQMFPDDRLFGCGDDGPAQCPDEEIMCPDGMGDLNPGNPTLIDCP